MSIAKKIVFAIIIPRGDYMRFFERIRKAKNTRTGVSAYRQNPPMFVKENSINLQTASCSNGLTYKTLDEVFLAKSLNNLLRISPKDAIRTFFTGMFNYVPAMPKGNIHAHNYYLYAKVFHAYFKDNPEAESFFSSAIESLLATSNIVDIYVAYEILISQLMLVRNAHNSFVVDKVKMIAWLERIFTYLRNAGTVLDEMQYGIAKMHPGGLKAVVNSHADIIYDFYNIDMRI